MYSAYKLNKQDDNIQPCHTSFPIWNQSVVPCPVLTVASWPCKWLVNWIKGQLENGDCSPCQPFPLITPILPTKMADMAFLYQSYRASQEGNLKSCSQILPSFQFYGNGLAPKSSFEFRFSRSLWWFWEQVVFFPQFSPFTPWAVNGFRDCTVMCALILLLVDVGVVSR